VSVTTKTADGRSTTVLYQLLSQRPRGGGRGARAKVTSVVVEDDPEVVYVPRYATTVYDPVWITGRRFPWASAWAGLPRRLRARHYGWRHH